MKIVMILFKKELKEIIKENRFLLMLIVTSVIMLVLPIGFFKKLQDTDPSLFNMALDFYFSYFSMMVIFFVSYSSAYNVFFKDKIKKTLDSLLATPVSIKQIWIAKTLAVFGIGYFLSLILSIVFLIIINFWLKPNIFLTPSIYSFFSLLFFNPIICLSLIGIFGILYLLLKDDTKIRLGFFILMMIFFYFMNPEKAAIGLTVVPFQLIVSIILILLISFSSKLLNPERIILSSD